jgi:glucokinase
LDQAAAARLKQHSPGDCALGLDIGGTKMAAGAVTRWGDVVVHEAIPTGPERGGPAVADDAVNLATELVSRARALGYRCSAVGISICELVSQHGEIVSAQTIPWHNLEIPQRFARLGPTFIEADARAAAICEARFGAAQQWPTFLYVTIGTGIGCSLVVNGQPFLGASGRTGTIATGPVTALCSACGAIGSSVVEQIAAGPGLARRYEQLAGHSAVTAQQVVGAAQAGDHRALDVIETAADCLGSSIGLLINVLDPHAVVIGGGLGSAAGPYWASLKSAVRRHIWSEAQREIPIVQGAFGGQAAFVGAAAVAFDRLGAGNPRNA